MEWYDEAKRHFLKSMKLDPSSPHPYNNLAVLLVENKEPEEALELSKKAIEIEPENPFHFETRSFAKLMLGDWSGFDDYEACLETGTRQERAYGNEPRWNGEKGYTVAIYREQGIGDEVMFSQMMNRAIKDCKQVIIDCDPRMVGIFKRSFPKALVFGTGKLTEGIEWLEDYTPDFHCAMGSLYRLYNTIDTEPYLRPDPVRVETFSKLMDKDRPNIGLQVIVTGKLGCVDL